jgi:3-hydroxybutyrate dehydrogenase
MKGKTALVTGSAAGLGLALALKLASEGCDIVLTGLETDSDGAEIAASIEAQYGVSALYRRADLRKPAEIEALHAAATGRFGAIDILINNAVIRRMAPVDTLPPEAWDDALAVNLSAAFHTIRLALPGMRAKGWGRIINLASVYSLIALPGRLDYVTTKHAIVGMTRTVALETAAEDITCNAICPGLMHTPSAQARIEEMARQKAISVEDATRDFLSTRQPGGRFIAMDTVTALAAFLCGPHSRDLNGAALPIDNGWSIA